MQSDVDSDLVLVFGIAITIDTGAIPLLVRRGGCAVHKKSGSHPIPRRRGWSLTRNVSKRIPKPDF